MVYQSKSDFLIRLVMACILAPLVLLIIKLSGFYFTAMILVAAIVMGGEWYNMTSHKDKIWLLYGVLYILLPCLSLLWIIQQHHILGGTARFNGQSAVISIFVLVWANDIGGYIFGRLFKGPKLCPQISPNKTWWGFFGGVACSFLMGPILGENMAISGLVAMIAALGDLFESWLKRCCAVKDSGDLIPGHGGLLDRADGVMMVSVVVAASALFLQ